VSPHSTTTETDVTAGPTTILVVDDREENRLVIRYLFDSPEHRVLEAADGMAGLALARKEHPDCILLDLSMPGLSGFDVLDELARDPRTRETPVIVLTATGDSLESMERVLHAGAVDYISKPISPQRVAIRVRGAIERRRLLRELHELRASFTSMLVHDLRAPLTVIKGYLELLQRPTLDPITDRQRRYLASMGLSADRMLKLIGEILDLSKLEAGKLALERRPMDLAALARDVADSFRPLATEKSITLAVVSPAGMPRVSADHGRMEQVLINLLHNALKFTPPGGAIRIEVQQLDDEVEVAVVDSGPGIPAEQMYVLFEKFGQASTAKSVGGPSTGLGLVVCRHLVEAHGGRIWAQSEEGQGARFVFRVPRARLLAEAA
jgi:signal transduction histidine kinase